MADQLPPVRLTRSTLKGPGLMLLVLPLFLIFALAALWDALTCEEWAMTGGVEFVTTGRFTSCEPARTCVRRRAHATR